VKVLIADGDARIRGRLAEQMVSRGGAEIVEARTGAEALEIALRGPVDAIILDVHLDADTGVGALVRLRRAAPDALIVVLTNEDGELHRRECIRHGADSYFDKSTEFGRAIELVLDAVDGAASRGSQG
jgi:DNA-binding response OmpR family regulator